MTNTDYVTDVCWGCRQQSGNGAEVKQFNCSIKKTSHGRFLARCLQPKLEVPDSKQAYYTNTQNENKK